MPSTLTRSKTLPFCHQTFVPPEFNFGVHLTKFCKDLVPLNKRHELKCHCYNSCIMLIEDARFKTFLSLSGSFFRMILKRLKALFHRLFHSLTGGNLVYLLALPIHCRFFRIRLNLFIGRILMGFSIAGTMKISLFGVTNSKTPKYEAIRARGEPNQPHYQYDEYLSHTFDANS